MTRYEEQKPDDGDVLYLEDTDNPLPEKLNPSTRYIHFKTIARGGKAIIQSCRDRFLGRVVCYKQLRSEFRDNDIEQLRFLREARISALLQHPSTIPTYDLGRDLRGDLYFTMKLVHGYTLREVLNYRERYDLGQMLNIIIQVAQALAYAHTHGVLHRDIKPENILVGPYGEVLLMDWGLAKVWAREDDPPVHESRTRLVSNSALDTSVTGLGGLEGTVTYMSPEQLEKAMDIDGRSDIFSLGVVLYEVVTGKTPAEAETVREMQEKVLTEPPAPPSSRVTFKVPVLLDNLIMSCLAKSKEDRPEDGLDIVRLLQEID
ncbi:MAG: serine/threonine protein kinase [Pseudomonadales bacterium]|nr:serine/threonine protein kinase [Pseudomonadales bacterium]MBO6565848.1 serine/threonine protein kinase [Pseudomonadales bacterium]MBO6594463.1 serine/threonine protein kinase [Pseudomonadales bacterium]MBO6658157.1 serine/threonine protein kinase [Pseudomonadales bacterium]MBO6700966.1 serine/threonine protein kinase [Pseudomonadales bacterium]